MGFWAWWDDIGFTLRFFVDDHPWVKTVLFILATIFVVGIMATHSYVKISEGNCYTRCQKQGYEHFQASYQKCTCYKGGTLVVEEPDAK